MPEVIDTKSEPEVEIVAEKASKLILKKVLYWTAVAVGFAAGGYILARTLEPAEKYEYEIDELETVDPEDVTPAE